MGLSRLDNFLKNVRGNILYVNPNDLDATDSIENQGNSLARPFKTIQRALIEAARFSYQRGLDNDRFGQTTIMLYPGDHIIDNRPGWIPYDNSGVVNYKLRNGTESGNLPPWDLTTNFDLANSDNTLYKLNSVHGGVILPRGTSIVGLDLRKTKIRPKYVPNPENSNIENSAIFRVTGSCYLWQFTILDADPNGNVYKDYTENVFVPNFSHHKLTAFEYADGKNSVEIDDAFLTYSTSRTDLDMYYEKVGLVYGQSSGRPIEPDYPSSSLDIQPKIDEYRIVGPTGGEVGITSIKAGDGTTSSTVITVTTEEPLIGADVDTAIRIEGISATGYDGQYVISEVVNSTQFKYNVSNSPANPSPNSTGATVNLSVDTVTSASPYIFNCSLRSVYGMCGLHADGNKADGFKSMVVAQFTGIGLQKDDNAFVKYDPTSAIYKDSTYPGNENIHTDSLAVYKPSYENFHIKASNNSFIQIVSVFAIGFANHFLAESGGDLSITNSNSNFGAKSLVSSGYRDDSFDRDDVGYITHIIPPREISNTDVNIEFNSIDIAKTISVGSTNRLYLYDQTNVDAKPENVIEGYRIGAKQNDSLKVLITQNGVPTEFSSRIIIPNTEFAANELSSEKIFSVGRNAGINSISSNILTLDSNHNFINGESIRFISDTGSLPDGIENNRIYYAITSGISSNQLKVAQTLNDALNSNQLTLNNSGGRISVISRVSDKNSGDIGHPIQYDSAEGQWYINVATASTENTIYPTIVSLGTTALGSATPRTYFTRKPDTRNLADTLYRVRYVIPAGSGITSARPPIDGFVIQESSDTTGATNSEVSSLFSPTSVSINNINEIRNFRFIANATWDGVNANYTTELPHNLSAGNTVEILNVTSTNNTSGSANLGYNGTFVVSGISSTKNFSVQLSDDPGTFTNDTSNRTVSLPRFIRKKYGNTYYLYRSQEIKKYVPGEQDGVYHLILLNSSNYPEVSPFNTIGFSQPIQYLYPQTDRDNSISDPKESVSHAVPQPVGSVVVDDPKHSLTKETVGKLVSDTNIGIGITNITSQTGTSHTVYTEIEHGLNRIVSVSIASSGAGYGSGIPGNIFNARLVSIGASTTGSDATALITVNGLGNVTSIRIMDGGSAYGIGNSLAIVGTATTIGYTPAIVNVTQVYNNVGDVVRISGIKSEFYSQYNDLYRITGVNVGSSKQFNVSSASTITRLASNGIDSDSLTNSYFYLTGRSLNVSSLSYDNNSGIATVVTSQNHGLRVDNKVRITGANNSFYNRDFIVKRNVDLNTFTLDVGVSTVSPSTAGTIYVYRNGFTSNDGLISLENENISGRQVTEYAGITTTLSASITSATTEFISVSGISGLDIRIGDYLQIDDEVVRVKSTVTGNPISVFRGVLGTRRETHDLGAVVRRISVTPIEFRRNSIIRASGHTFEYLGFGPGNYSTAFPDRQDRKLTSAEEFLSQSTKIDGGINVYTGMNSDGDFYVGNKKVNSATGQEEVFDAPIPTVTGEDISPSGVSVGFDVISPLEVTVTRSLRVEGGSDGSIISEFDGPVIINNKLTSTSSKGIEASSIFLQGDSTVSRKYTVGISTPVLAGTPGDVVYRANPVSGGSIGWVYTTDNDWYRFGNISLSKTSNIGLFDSLGVGVTSIDDCIVKVGFGTSFLCIDENGVGIGTTANEYDLQVNGTIRGIFVGDGSQLTNLDSIWEEDGTGTYIYDKDNVNHLVGIGTNTGITAQLHIAGIAQTSLYVQNQSRFISTSFFQSDVVISGILSATNFDLNNSTSGQINAGIVTASSILNVGAGGTVITALSSSGSVGVGTLTPRAKFDIEGSARFKTYSENVKEVTSSGNNVNIDLSEAQTFTLTVTERIDQFTILNPPADASSFTIKITQDSVGYAVGIDTFKAEGGSSIPVYWPGGGVLPIVTTTANKTDIYSFMTFDGCSTLYGVIGGQNFA